MSHVPDSIRPVRTHIVHDGARMLVASCVVVTSVMPEVPDELPALLFIDPRFGKRLTHQLDARFDAMEGNRPEGKP